MIPLTRMRLTAFLRTGRALAPLLTALVVLTVLYGGGAARPAEAYGVSAVVLFPVIAWQTKLLLDAEPDVQRRLALVTVGGASAERLAGLFAATVAGLGTVAVGMLLPWLVGGVSAHPEPGDPSVPVAVALGAWAHLCALPAGVALGALASRACIGSLTYGLAVLVLGGVGAVALGRADSVAPWLAPPIMATARATAGGVAAGAALLTTLHGLLWAAALFAVYAWRRRRYG